MRDSTRARLNAWFRIADTWLLMFPPNTLKSADVRGRQKECRLSTGAVMWRNEMKDVAPGAAITLQCPRCSHEFPMSAAVLGSVRATVAQDLQADLRRREAQLADELSAA